VDTPPPTPPVYATDFHRRLANARDPRRLPLLTAGEAETISELLGRLADDHPGEDLGVFAAELAMLLCTRLEELGY
jgi:hypothetical protein